MLTLSIIKADTGGYVGHSAVHPDMVAVAQDAVRRAAGDLLVDAQVATCGDDLSLIMTHMHGCDAEVVHRFAWDVFLETTAVAKSLGLYGAGQDLLQEAFSGNLRGMGPGYAELEFVERPSEPVLCFLADKTEPGAWNLPLYRMFADPFATAGLVIDPKMHAGFTFEVHDLYEGRKIEFSCPNDLYDLLLYIGSPSRYVIKRIRSNTIDEVAAATSTQRLGLMAGRYVGKDDPVMIVRCAVRPTGRRRGTRTVRLPSHRGWMHAGLAPRADDAGADGASSPGPVRRSAAHRVPRVPGPRRQARRAA